MEVGKTGASSLQHKALSLLSNWSVSTIPTLRKGMSRELISRPVIGHSSLFRTQSPTLNQKTPPGKLFKVTFGSRTDSAARTLFPEPCIPWSVRNFPGVSSDKPFFIAASYKNKKINAHSNPL